MLDDRSYMRREQRDFRPSVCITIIVILCAVFLVENMGAKRAFDFEGYLALSKAGLMKLYLWQLVTFQFLHSGPFPLHLIFNCLTLYFLGREVERAIGPKSFLKLYFFSGFLGGLFQTAIFFLPIPGAETVVVGASAGIAGVFAACALLFPQQELTLLFLPFRIKPLHLLWTFAAISLIGTIIPFGNIAHAAHLGGLVAGYVYLRWGTQAESFFARRGHRQARLRPRELMKVPLGKSSPWQRAKNDSVDIPAEEFISREVDPILDKISAHGIQSLTPRERQILEAARSKMEKR
jgi:membrane associated rhomboid family serine protease